MLRPLNDQVVVEPVKPPESNHRGVLLTEDASKQYHGLRAVVLAVGPGVLTLSGARVPIDLSPGDVVVLRHAGPLIREGDRVLCVVPEREIIAVVEDGARVTRYAPSETGAAGLSVG